MRLLALAIVTASITALTACSTSDAEHTSSKSNASAEPVACETSTGTKTAFVSVKGMTCEMGCGGAIKKAVHGVAGVEESELDFETNRPVDMLRVSYDASKTCEGKIVQAIEGVDHGNFEVIEIVVEDDVPAESTETDEAYVPSSEDEGFQTSQRAYELPNLVDMLQRMF